MKALRDRILVKSYQHQKEALTIIGAGGKVIELFIGRKYLENHRVKNPVMAEVLDNNSKYQYIKKGDYILVHHNLIDSPKTNQYCIEYDPQTGIGIYSLPSGDHIFCKLLQDGSAYPVCGNMLIERIENPIKTKFIIIPDTISQVHTDRVKILSVSPEVEDIKIKDIVLMYRFSDYEICYSWNKKDYKVIKINENDILGLLK